MTSIVLYGPKNDPLFGRLNKPVSRIRNPTGINDCQYRVFLSCGNSVDVDMLTGIGMIEEMIRKGVMTPNQIEEIHDDIVKAVSFGAPSNDTIKQVNDLLAVCLSHIEARDTTRKALSTRNGSVN